MRVTYEDFRSCQDVWREGMLEETETVMLSIGYADVEPDGTVVAFGRVVLDVSDAPRISDYEIREGLDLDMVAFERATDEWMANHSEWFVIDSPGEGEIWFRAVN